MINVLTPGIYEGDNGAMTCDRCAGSTAKRTGRDIYGTKMRRITDADAAAWIAVIGRPVSCETCNVTRDKVGSPC